VAEPLLQVEGLRYHYPDGTTALRGVDLTIQTGQKIGLVGPNGSGKSTLLMCLSGLFKGQGAIRVDGAELTTTWTSAARKRVGLIFQNPDDQLFMPVLADDLAFGPVNLGLDPAEVRRRVAESASQMGLTEMLDRPPHHLSMGQKRTAAIATVLTMRPDLLLMDEPSSNLDPRWRRRLIDLLASVQAALLIASHDLALIGRVCETVCVIDEGTIVAQGNTRDILGDAAVMEKHGLDVWPDTCR
jgi:cobalt/nickel transport system ATP-binding protein